MKIAITQMNIVWEDKNANMQTCDRLAKEAASEGATLIVFPEMTLTGFTMNTAAMGEKDEKNGTTATFFKNLSVKYGIAIVFGMIKLTEDGKAYNKEIMVQGDEIKLNYSKIHPFSYGLESGYYIGGETIESTEYKNLKIGGFICYDLRFPEVFQVSSKVNRMIIVIANWPESRVDHWNTLLKARAIENQTYIAGVNRVGDGAGLHYASSSAVFDPYGKKLTPDSNEELLYADIDTSVADGYREEFKLKQDRKEDLYKKLF